jgi:uncharacterized protein YkwD
MIRRSVSRSALVASLLLGGCYTGLDDLTTGLTPGSASMSASQVDEGGEPETGDATTGGGTTANGATDDPSNGSTDDPSNGPTNDVTTGDESTGSLEGTTTTGDDTLPDPSTTTTTMPETTMDPPDPTTMDPPDPPPDSDVPDNAYCAAVANYDPAWRQLEEDVLAIVNQKRAAGANCGGAGNFGPTGPLTMDPALRCAARKHSLDMDARDFFDHTNPDGQLPWDRMGMAGYGDYSNAGENIAAGSPDAAGTMQQWMDSDGHCSNIMSPDFQHIGVGYHPGGQYGHLWTQVFGAK